MKKTKKLIAFLLLVITCIVSMGGCANKGVGDGARNVDFTLFREDLKNDIENEVPAGDESLDSFVENADDGLEPIDVFDGIRLTPYGANGYGSVRFSNDLKDTEFSVGDFYFKPADYKSYELMGYYVLDVLYNNKEICQIGYDIVDMWDLDDTLSEGDTIKLEATIEPANAFEELGFKPTYSKEVTVPDLGEYVTSKEQVTLSVVNKLCTKEVLGNVFYNLRDVEFGKAYFVKAKPNIEIDGNCPYSIVIVYKAYSNYENYYISKFNDVVIRDGDVVSFGSKNTHVMSKNFFGGGNISSFSSLEEACFEVENNFDSQFAVEKIEL